MLELSPSEASPLELAGPEDGVPWLVADAEFVVSIVVLSGFVVLCGPVVLSGLVVLSGPEPSVSASSANRGLRRAHPGEQSSHRTTQE